MVSPSCKVTSFAFAVIIAAVSLQFYRPSLFYNARDETSGSPCTGGSFILSGMSECHKWLECEDIKKEVFVTDEVLGNGAQKIVKIGVWRGNRIAVNTLIHKEYLSDFVHGMDMLKLLNTPYNSKKNKVVQFVGGCLETPVILTEVHRLGPASNFEAILKEHFPGRNRLLERFSLCQDFVEILIMLHTHPLGVRVLCDANDPIKALSQFLVSENLSLVLNDVDALPVVDRNKNHLIKCGHRELGGDFVAPEQLWPFDEAFDDSRMPPYDEKVDIWKIPDVCGALMNNVPGISKLQLKLFNIYSRCKTSDPIKRPTAVEVFDVLSSVFIQFKIGDERPDE